MMHPPGPEIAAREKTGPPCPPRTPAAVNAAASPCQTGFNARKAAAIQLLKLLASRAQRNSRRIIVATCSTSGDAWILHSRTKPSCPPEANTASFLT